MQFECLQYVGALIPANKLIKNSDKFIAGAGAGVTAVNIPCFFLLNLSVSVLRLIFYRLLLGDTDLSIGYNQSETRIPSYR